MRTKITRAPCRKRTGAAVPRAINFGDLTTAELTKVLGVNLETIIDMQSWCKTWPPMDASISVQDKNFSGNTKELAKVLVAE